MILYMDVHIPAAIMRSLRAADIVVITAQEDGMRRSPDTVILDRARHMDAAVVTMDRDFVIEAARRQRRGEPFAGVVFLTDAHADIGSIVADLTLIARVYEPPDLADRVEYLPL